MNDGTFDVALDFQGDSVDEPTYQFARHISVDLSSNRGGYTDRALDELFDRQKDLTDPRERYRAVRAFEQRMLEESYTVPLLWWQRIVVMRSSVKGWGMTPSHLIGQDLETVWLKP
jgi:peptide/nickel transport system substrate-binding protein